MCDLGRYVIDLSDLTHTQDELIDILRANSSLDIIQSFFSVSPEARERIMEHLSKRAAELLEQDFKEAKQIRRQNDSTDAMALQIWGQQLCRH